jgi:uncharacterized peroxidase-related enzyme
VAVDYRAAALEPRARALCDFAARLTRAPATISTADVEALRQHGLDDAAVHDAIQVIAYFNYVNRVADGVGVDDEPEWDGGTTES